MPHRADSAQAITLDGPRNPRLAAALSVLIPGLGNVYAGEPVRGALHFGSVLGAIGLVSAANISSTHDSITPWGWLAVCTLAASYVWGIVDCAFLGERLPQREHSADLPGVTADITANPAMNHAPLENLRLLNLVSLQFTF